MKLLTIWERLGKQPLKVTRNNEAKVFINNEEHVITKIRYESGRWIGFEAVKKCYDTCANNIEYPPAHTCDICTSLDQEEMYERWKAKRS